MKLTIRRNARASTLFLRPPLFFSPLSQATLAFGIGCSAAAWAARTAWAALRRQPLGPALGPASRRCSPPLFTATGGGVCRFFGHGYLWGGLFRHFLVDTLS